MTISRISCHEHTNDIFNVEWYYEKTVEQKRITSQSSTVSKMSGKFPQLLPAPSLLRLSLLFQTLTVVLRLLDADHAPATMATEPAHHSPMNQVDAVGPTMGGALQGGLAEPRSRFDAGDDFVRDVGEVCVGLVPKIKKAVVKAGRHFADHATRAKHGAKKTLARVASRLVADGPASLAADNQTPAAGRPETPPPAFHLPLTPPASPVMPAAGVLQPPVALDPLAAAERGDAEAVEEATWAAHAMVDATTMAARTMVQATAQAAWVTVEAGQRAEASRDAAQALVDATTHAAHAMVQATAQSAVATVQAGHRAAAAQATARTVMRMVEALAERLAQDAAQAPAAQDPAPAADNARAAFALDLLEVLARARSAEDHADHA